MAKAKKGTAKAASKAERKKAKLTSKAERKEAKTLGGTGNSSGKKGKGKAKEDKVDEDDLIHTLEEYRKRWQEEHAISEEVTDVPSRRANATLTACPVSSCLWLYGGEYFDGTSCFFYPDLFRYNPEKNSWTKLSSPTQPSPRSAHQVVATAASGGRLWLFGGEFAASNQTSFHHFRDFWSYDIGQKAWERFETKVKPSARSGHRMAAWKHYIILYGGFHDVGIRTTYLSDLWLWDTIEFRWHEVILRDADRKPTARSGFSFLPCPEGLVLHGGYCKEYKGKQVKGVELDDTWLLRMDTEPQKIKWERRKKVGYAPTVRSGVQMAMWSAKGMGIMFGGVHDSYEGEDDDLTSLFYNEVFGYQTSGNGRWVSMALKRPKKKAPKKSKKAVRRAQRQDEDVDVDEDLDMSDMDGDESVQTNGNKTESSKTEPQDSSSDEDDPDDPQRTIPIARYNAMMAVQRNTLYIYGGIVEAQNREYTLDDFYTLPLDKLDRFTCLRQCNIAELEWKESDSEDDDGSESGSESESEDSNDEEEEIDGPESTTVNGNAGSDEHEDTEMDADDAKAEVDLRAQATAFMGVAMNAQRPAEELLSTPLPGETLKTFYDRTREYWAQTAHATSDNRGKALRKDGFALADERYNEYKPILEEIERIQAEAEDDDVVKSAAAKPSGLGVDSRHRR